MRSIFFTSSMLILHSLLLACPEPECVAANSCSDGKRCVEGVCEDRNPVGQPDVGEPSVTPQPTVEPQDGGVDVEVSVDLSVNWMSEDPLHPGKALFSQVDAVRDAVFSLDLSTGVVSNDAVYDFARLQGGGCIPDGIPFVTSTTPAELWISCTQSGGPKARILYVGSETDPPFEPDIDFHQGLYLDDVAAVGDAPRGLAFERGKPGIRSFEMLPALGAYNERIEDTVVPTFTEVVALYALPTPPSFVGESVLVHDAESGKLTAILRESNTYQWDSSRYLDVMDLPERTHIAYPIGTIQAGGVGSGLANLVTLHPVEGTARFWNYETGLELGSSFQFESGSRNLPSELPGVDERRLVSVTPSGDFLFYGLYGGKRIWRIPLKAPFTGTMQFIESGLEGISGFVPLSDSEAWVSYSGERRLQRLSAAN